MLYFYVTYKVNPSPQVPCLDGGMVLQMNENKHNEFMIGEAADYIMTRFGALASGYIQSWTRITKRQYDEYVEKSKARNIRLKTAIQPAPKGILIPKDMER